MILFQIKYKGKECFRLKKEYCSLYLQHSHVVYLILISAILFFSCRKMVEIPQPSNSITTVRAFNSDANAASAIIGIYSNIASAGQSDLRWGNGSLTIDAGLMADEIIQYGATNQFYTNNLLASDAGVYGIFWSPMYFNIYQTNAAIEGLTASTELNVKTKNQLIGEAKFMRALVYFYMVNLFGDVPLVLSTDFKSNSSLSRTNSTKVYDQIIADLKDAESLLQDNYDISGGERVRANKWAAKALLARAFLYTGKYSEAEDEANSVISNSSLFDLEANLNNVFLKNSPEAIFQLQSIAPAYTTLEGKTFVPENLTRDYDQGTVNAYWQFFIPNYFLTDQLLNSFESGDQRKSKWCDSTGKLSSINYFYPYKYKVRLGTQGNVKENYTILRLAEQFLIRSEARAKQHKLPEAIDDLNVIRNRAGLASLSASLGQSEILAALARENRVEFFCELGHRWFDLKRTGQADTVLGLIKGSNWQNTDQLFPIPLTEIQTNSNLSQNPGY